MPRTTPYYVPKERIKNLITRDENDCWNWKGSIRNGYGRLVVGSRTDNTRKSESAHRYAYQIYIGDIPDGLIVCHTCDNPKCVNPKHLFLGTRQDNVDDREVKGRNNHVFGEKNPKSKLTEEMVFIIRNSDETSRRLAKIFGVNKSTILDVKNGKSWKHLLPKPPEEQK